ncbi:conserved protein of unknown function [Thermococcus nautili]|uniref:hypothetical protein n=1 Tax=Thermococcus nautili TaxID=195522 RepID=UPI002552CE71|nr:hypothetical protein [Thermococcus nautili]CAI1493839.1 conserved protein of unknown function [Thermococcus nautili]
MSEIVVKIPDGVDERLAKLAIERALKRLKVANETFGTLKPKRNADELIAEADEAWTT